MGEGLAGWVAVRRQPTLVDDVTKDARWKAVPGVDDCVRSALSVPLLSGDQLVGVLTIGSEHPAYFNDDHRRLVESAAASVAAAIANARLYEAEREQFRRLQQTQAQLVQAEKMSALGRLASSIAHEINNPLQAMQGCLTLAEEELEDSQRRDRLMRYLQMAGKEVERLSNLVRRMRDFYRPPRQEWCPTDVNAVLESVLELTAEQLQRTHITLERNLAGGLPMIQANPDMLKQLFLNLVLNAIDAMSAHGGTLCFRTAPDQLGRRDGSVHHAVRVEIGDTGGGIPPNVLAHLFEPFVTTKRDGTGLGLSISYGIVEAHNGQIAANSQSGVGTTFVILLPVEQPQR